MSTSATQTTTRRRPHRIGRQRPLVAIGTMHGKEALIGPVLAHLGLDHVVPAGFDTDRYGTFTGEVARHLAPLDAARSKARDAARIAGTALGVGSEGSIVPHPHLPALHIDTEVVVLVDLAEGTEFVGRATSIDVVAGTVTATSCEEALAAATRCGFPEHAVVVGPAAGTAGPLAKGILDVGALRRAVTEELDRSGSARIQTDLRAHLNPTRRLVIADAAHMLADSVRTACPACEAPGFGIDRHEPGLPCMACGTPTGEIGAEIRRCARCGCERSARPPLAADPSHCPICNP